MSDYPQTERSRIRRKPERGDYSRETIYPIIDEALICHVAFEDANGPVIIPTLHARQGDRLYLHGAKSSRLIQHLQSGGEVSVAVTLVDGIVFARSAFHSSINYRSAVLFGRGRPVETDEEKMLALALLTEHIAPGRWHDARQPNQNELNGTAVVAVTIETASAKTRGGPPQDAEEDALLPVWSGVLPLALQAQAPQPDPAQTVEVDLPAYISGYDRRQRPVK